MPTIQSITSFNEFLNWLELNHDKEKECFIPNLKRGKPKDDNNFYYIDAVYAALCYGWIDSTCLKIDGVLCQRFSPRRKSSCWTPLNLARVKYLINQQYMTEDGLAVVPKEEIIIDDAIIKDLQQAGIYDTFKTFPKLYQSIRLYNLQFNKNLSIDKYQISLNNLIKYTKQNKMYGNWDDYGRITNL